MNHQPIGTEYKSGTACSSILPVASACGVALFLGRFYKTV
jgi:hypothetical protein